MAYRCSFGRRALLFTRMRNPSDIFEAQYVSKSNPHDVQTLRSYTQTLCPSREISWDSTWYSASSIINYILYRHLTRRKNIYLMQWNSKDPGEQGHWNVFSRCDSERKSRHRTQVLYTTERWTRFNQKTVRLYIWKLCSWHIRQEYKNRHMHGIHKKPFGCCNKFLARLPYHQTVTPLPPLPPPPPLPLPPSPYPLYHYRPSTLTNCRITEK